MPITPIEGNGTPATTPGAIQPGSISDLGDILMDKSLDVVQKNDFVPVSKTDVEMGEDESEPFKPTSSTDSTPIEQPVVESPATVEDLQNIMLEVGENSSPFVDEQTTTDIENKEVETKNTPTELTDISLTPDPVAEGITSTEPAVNTEISTSAPAMDIDLGNIVLPEIIETPVIEEMPVVADTTISTENSIPTSIDPIMENIVLPEVEATIETPVVEETPIISEEIPMVADTTITEPIIDSSITMDQQSTSPIEPTIDTDIMNVNIPEVVSEEPARPMFTSNIGEEMPVVADTVTSTENSIPTMDSSLADSIPTEQTVVENSMDIDLPISDTTDSLTTTSDTVPTGAVPTTEVIPQVSPEMSALEKVADDITQGIDLDSLMVDAPVQTPEIANTVAGVTAPVTEQPAEGGFKAMFSGATGGQKKLLIGLGAFLILGLIYFGYQSIAGINNSDTQDTIVNTDTTGAIDTGSTTTDTGMIDALSGDSTTNTENTGTDNTQVDSGTTIDTGSTTAQETPKTRDELIALGKDLTSKVRKALIKATIAKNESMRQSAFTLQKDLETFTQTLENTNNITTLSDSEKTLGTLSQRLDSILQTLNGSNQ